MSTADPARTPVLVGSAQWEDRTPAPPDVERPLDVLAHVVRSAADDAGLGDLAAIDTVGYIRTSGWEVTNVGDALARTLGIPSVRSVDVGGGGEVGVSGINWLARQIVEGSTGVAVLAGVHRMRSQELAARKGLELTWQDHSEGEPTYLGRRGYPVPGSEEYERASGIMNVERAAGLEAPPHIYPLFENALAHHLGHKPGEHREVVGRLMSRFTEVAAANPHAWYPNFRSPEELITPTPSNRMVAFPYTKYLNAILQTDQSAALILMSEQRARDLGIPSDRWVHWWGGHGAAEEAWFPSTRPDFAACPSMLDSHLGALELAGLTMDDVDLIDFYSCFAAPVEMACRMLGLSVDDERGFTLTGGLPYGGGPGSAYTLHSLATMVDRVREQPDATAMITGNGFYLTKHAASLWSGRPRPGGPPQGAEPERYSGHLEHAPVVPVVRAGAGTVETFTVVHARDDSPGRLIAIGRFDDAPDERFLANGLGWTVEDLDVIERDGFVGRRVDVRVVDGACAIPPE
ncbi:hypothetical protein NHL50_18220 [Acidimicrobiia bacterium EGI L10123]|uniref:hypothetical protein n=1 Tax=Salinilacustrithrix flava TaxID=2957203 RepID=UPI003D7C1A84|nr:hypothetical protein [Acidimicrobiia bacterium EGI L10123]